MIMPDRCSPSIPDTMEIAKNTILNSNANNNGDFQWRNLCNSISVRLSWTGRQFASDATKSSSKLINIVLSDSGHLGGEISIRKIEFRNLFAKNVGFCRILEIFADHLRKIQYCISRQNLNISAKFARIHFNFLKYIPLGILIKAAAALSSHCNCTANIYTIFITLNVVPNAAHSFLYSWQT